jgi:aspartyl-tRNA synthetase
MTYEHALKTYGTTNQTFVSEWSLLNVVAQNNEFPVFNAAELVVAIAVPGAGNYTRKKLMH